jgi:hypothetical protein
MSNNKVSAAVRITGIGEGILKKLAISQLIRDNPMNMP